MNNSAGMSGGESASNLYGDVNRTIQVEAATCQLLAKGGALDEFRSNKVQSFGLPKFINSENIGVIKSGSRVGFLFETAQHTFIAG